MGSLSIANLRRREMFAVEGPYPQGLRSRGERREKSTQPNLSRADKHTMSITHFPGTLKPSSELRSIDVRAQSEAPRTQSAKIVRGIPRHRLSFITRRHGSQNVLIANRPCAIWYTRKGARELKRGNATKAAKLFRKSIEADSSYALAHAGLGSALFLLGKKKAALACYDRAISKDPSEYKYYNNRGVIRTGLKQYVLAEKDLVHASKLSPKKATVFFNLAWIYVERKKYAEAIKCLKKAAELGLKSVDLRFLRAKALQGLGEHR